MLALARLAQQVDGAALDDVDAVVDEDADSFGEAQLARLAVDHSQEDHGEAFLKLGVLVELVEDDLRLRAALEADDHSHAVAIAFVARPFGAGVDVGDDLVVDELRDALEERGLVDLIRQLGDDERLPVFGDVFRGDAGAHEEAATAGAIGVNDAGAAVENGAGREVGPFDVLEDFGEAGFGILDQIDGGVDDFSEIVRRNVGGHADSDAARSVDDEIGDARGKNGRLDGGLVVVGNEVDGFHVDVGHHFAGDALHAALGVAHGGGRIAVDGAEVALPIDERAAQRKGLRHADQRVVDGGVAVGMVDTHGLADDLGALGVFLVVLQAHLAHGVEHAAMDGLEAVAGIRKRAPDDHRHGVVEIGAAHLLFNVDGNEVGAAGRARWVERELGILIVWHRVFEVRGKAAKRSGEGGAGSAGLYMYFSGLERVLARLAVGNKALFCLNLWGDFNSG